MVSPYNGKTNVNYTLGVSNVYNKIDSKKSKEISFINRAGSTIFDGIKNVRDGFLFVATFVNPAAFSLSQFLFQKIMGAHSNAAKNEKPVEIETREIKVGGASNNENIYNSEFEDEEKQTYAAMHGFRKNNDEI